MTIHDALVLFDCGPGTLHGFDQHGIAWPDLTHIVISHYHNDHVGDLAAVLFALKHGVSPARTDPLNLIGPMGFRGFISRLADAFGPYILDPGFEICVTEVAAGSSFVDSANLFRIRSCHTPHTEESLAWRLEGESWVLGYTGDTGPSVEVANFMLDCQVLIAECALSDPPQTNIHLPPRPLAAFATIASPELLIVTHVYPFQFQGPEEVAAQVQEWAPVPTLAAVDGLRVTLGSEGPDWTYPPNLG